MPKEKSEKNTRTSRKATTTAAKDGKEKRKPTAYNLFMKEHLSKWRADHPGSEVKEAMAAVAKMWKEAPENPKNKEGGETKAPKEKENKKKPAEKDNKKKPVEKDDEEPAEKDTEETAAAEGSEASEEGDE